MTEFQDLERTDRQIDRNSLLLLFLLIVPTINMAAVLFLWPNVTWVAEIPRAAIVILGSFAALLLSVFIITRYRSHPGILYISAGLVAIGIIDGFHALSPPGSTQFAWLHSFAGIAGGAFFTFYVLTRMTNLPLPAIKTTVKRAGWLLGGVAAAAFLFGVLTLVFSDTLPAMVRENRFTPTAWIINAIPIVLYLFAGFNLFRQYRKTGAHELFLFTVILIFLFQASEVFYFAPFWSILWWLWQALQLTVYLTVLGYILKEYIQTSSSLAAEVDERKKVEKALRKADEDWRNSFNSLEEAMMIIDRDYNIENINNGGLGLIGKKKEEVIGQKCYRVLHTENKPEEYCPFQQTLKTKKVESVERYDESRGKHFSLKSAPIFDESGEIIKFVYLMGEITKRINAEEKERVLQQELNLAGRLASIGEVAAGLTHEINNPLTSVIAFAQMLAQMDVPEDFKEAVEVINDGANRVSGIVEKLLTFARRNRPDKEYADINSVITNTLGMRSYEMRLNNTKVTTRLDSNLPRTMANIGQLQQVFLNIIINAEQAMAGSNGKGKLAIKTERANSSIRVSLADTGPGISPEDINKIFDPFFTTKGPTQGTGLGLSVSYGIINEHGGKIHAKSEPDKGATFIIDLPIVAEDKAPTMSRPADREIEKASPGSRIIVVDDEPNICRALDRLLTRDGYQVETISKPQTALKKLATANYDLVLLDIRMPDMDGIEFYDRMKEIDPLFPQKVICITGDVISPANQAFLDKNGIPCIAKPFGTEELKALVKSVLGGKTSHAQATYSNR